MTLIRLLLVIASMSPLFILLAIKGLEPFFDHFLTFIFFLLLVIIPNLYFWYRIKQAKHNNDRKNISIHEYTDNKEHIVSYTFALLIPMYQSSIATQNDLYAALCALIFILFIFWHLDLYYMNFIMALFGYKIISIKGNPATSLYAVEHVLITKRSNLNNLQNFSPLRLTDFLLFDDN